MSSTAVKVNSLSSFYDFSRGKHTFLSLSQPAMAAIIGGGGLPPARTMMLGLAAATAGYFSVYSLNDLLDRRIDHDSLVWGKSLRDARDIGVAVRKHPLALGHLSLAASMAWVIGLGVMGAALAFAINPMCTAFFAGCVGLEITYCKLRRVTWLKTFISGAMVSLGALAGWVAVAPLDRRAVFVFTFFALWEIYGRNFSNDLADVDSDRKVGIKTVATVFGEKVSAYSILLGSGALALFSLLMPLPALSRAILALAAIALMVRPAIALARNPVSSQSSDYFKSASQYTTVALLAMLPLI